MMLALLILLSATAALGQLALNSLTGNPPGISPNVVQAGTGSFTITLKGTGFTTNSVARLGAASLTTTFFDANTLTAIVPAPLLKTVGAQGVTVIDGGGTSNSINLMVSYRADANGNGLVNISDALNIARSAGGALLPAIPASIGDLNLSDAVNISDALVAALFSGGARTNLDTPFITSTSVSSSAAPGAVITLTGTGFSLNPGDNVVVFSKSGGGFTYTVISSVVAGSGTRTLTAAIPNDAASGPVFVKRRDLGLPGHPFVVAITGSPLPVYISKVTPAVALTPGVSMTIAGSGFDPAPANNTVQFSAIAGTVSGTVTQASATSIVVTVPADAISGFVRVAVNNQTSNGKSILVSGTTTPLLINHVYYNDAAGEPILIEGTGFNPLDPSDNQVLFSDPQNTDVRGAVVAAGRTELIALAPAGVAAGTLKVKTGGGANASNSFNYSGVSNPAIASITFLDAANAPVSELVVNQGNTLQTSVRVYDSTGSVRTDVALSYSSLNPEIASVDTSGVLTGRRAGFSTLTVSGGGVVATATITVVEVISSAASSPVTGIAQDLSRRLYLAASQNQTILLAADISQTPSVYAGIHQTPGLRNDVRLQSLFRNPSFLAFDQAGGTLYVSDSSNNVIRKVTPGSSGTVETFAGTTAAGNQDGAAASATFNNPQGLALDNSGNLWIVDSGNNTIRRINLATRMVQTIAGLAGIAGSADGTAGQARFNGPVGIAFEPETLPQQLSRFFRAGAPPPVSMLVADAGNGTIRRVKETGVVETLSTNAIPSSDSSSLRGIAADAGPTALHFNAPAGIAADPFGNIYLTLPSSGDVKIILPGGSIVAAAQANTFHGPRGVAVSESGKVVVANDDRSAQQVRFGGPQITGISPAQLRNSGGQLVTITGSNFPPGSSVIIGSTVISNPTISNTSMITFTTPELVSGRTTLTITNRGGSIQTPVIVTAASLSDLPAGYITTVAGGSTYAGEGSLAAQVPITPFGIAVDANGNVFFADQLGRKVRRVDARTGILTTVAGNGSNSGGSGDNGPAVAAGLSYPTGVAFDPAGNLLVSDASIRRIDAQTGNISTIIGGQYGFCGDGGNALNACFNYITGFAVDASGNIYITDRYNNRVRRVDAATNIITTIAGTGDTGFAGDNGDARSATLNQPYGPAVDSVRKFLYFADAANGRVRKVDLVSNIITTVAGGGNPASGIGDGGPGIQASVGPDALALDSSGNLLISDREHARIRKLDIATGIISTVAGSDGTGSEGDGGPATSATLHDIFGIAVDAAGNVLIPDAGSFVIRRVDAISQIISTFAGNRTGFLLGDGGPATAGALRIPAGVAVDAAGNLFITDTDNQRIRKVAASDGTIDTIAGDGGAPSGIGDGGPARISYLSSPQGRVGVDTAGNVYIADRYNYRVRKIQAGTGVITTIAGNGNSTPSGDGGQAANAGVNPDDIAVDSQGNLYFVEDVTHRIRKVNLATGIIMTAVGGGTGPGLGDNGPATAATLGSALRITIDGNGNLFIADADNNRVRRVDATTQIITTVVGGGASYTENQPATSVSVAPLAVNIDASGNLFIVDYNYPISIKRVSGGIIKTVAGGNDSTTSPLGDNGPALSASFNYPHDVAVDGQGNIYIVDTVNERIRAVRGPVP